MSAEQVDWDFGYHAPTPVTRMQHEDVRTAFKRAAQALNGLVPPGREAALAMTHLEQAMFWANAAIARQRPAE